MDHVSSNQYYWTYAHASFVGYDAQSYIRAIAKTEIDWIKSYAHLPDSQNQTGAWHTPDQHVFMLEQWTRLARAVLPRNPSLCSPTLMHSDLHVSNILVEAVPVASPANDNSFNFELSGIIDWQGSAVRPLFETTIPAFLDTPGEAQLHIQPTVLHSPPIIVSNSDSLDEAKSIIATGLGHYLQRVYALSPELSFVMQSPHMEILRDTIYYSSYSWADGLPNLESSSSPV